MSVALVMTRVSTEAMGLMLAEISQAVPAEAHAVVVLDGAGWHSANELEVLANLTLLSLPPYSPELNAIGRLWQVMRETVLSHRLFTDTKHIIDACCRAWNALIRQPERIRSTCGYPWALQVGTSWTWYQSVKTTEAGGPRGYDGGKKVSGRKRQTLVDTEGDILKVRVHPADLHDKAGGMLLLAGLHLWFPALPLVWADTHYQGLKTWAKERLGWTIEVVKHWWTGVQGFWLAPGQEPPEIPKGFHVLPRRWVAERTFAWLGRHRRLSKDYERLPASEETFIYMAMNHILAKRLARPPPHLP